MGGFIAPQGEQSTSSEITLLTALNNLAISPTGFFIRKTGDYSFENADPNTGESTTYLTDAPSDGYFYGRKDGGWAIITGDVKGPVSSIANNIVVFSGNTGKIIKDGGKKISDLLYLDQTTPQAVINGSPIMEGIQFDTTPSTSNVAEGLLRWNLTDGTLDLGMSGGDITMQIGQEIFIKVRNPSGGSTIVNGSPVYISGRTGVFPDISLARSDSELTSCCIGITTQDIASPAYGYVTTFGYVRGIKTDYTGDGDWGTTWNMGDKLYVSKTIAGQLTNVEPTTPHHSDIVATVGVISATQGSILVVNEKHYALEELTDVNGTALSTTGQFPMWNNTAGYFDFNKNFLTDSLQIDQTTPQTIINGRPIFNVGLSANADVYGTNINYNEGLLSDPTITDATGVAISVTSVDCLIRSDSSWGADEKLYRKTVPENTSLAVTDNSINYIYVTWNSGTPIYAATTDRSVLNNSDAIPVARVQMESGSILYQIIYEYLGKGLAARNFDRVMRIRGRGGIEPESGLGISETATRVVNIEAGYAWFGMSRKTMGAIAQGGVGVVSELWYHSSGVWTHSDVTAYNNTQYDNGTDLVTLTANRYAVNWIFRNLTTNSIDIVLGTGDYTLAQAEASMVPTLPDAIANFYVLCGRIIVQKASDTAYAIENVSTSAFNQAAVTSHPDLSTLAWTSSGHTGTASTIAGFAAATGAAAEYTLSGTGTALPTTTAPTFVTSITTPLIIGGTDAGSNIIYKSTTGAGTAAGISHQFTGGTNGAKNILTMLNNGNMGIGIANPTSFISFGSNVAEKMINMYEAAASKIYYGFGIASNELRSYVSGTAGFFSWGQISTSDGTTFTERMRLTNTALQITGNIELGHATENTLSASGGVLSIEGTAIPKGTGTTNEIAYWSGTNTLGTLAVATYPSLTELSYVKGASSALQTQITARATSASPTFTGTITLSDNTRIDLTLPSADTYCTGNTTDSFQSGYTASAGDLVFMGSSSKWLEVDADAVATCKGLLGIALEAKNDTEVMKVALPGSFVRFDAWNWTVGATLYAGETLGAMQEAIPTGADAIIKVVGFAVNADTIFFMPSSDQQSCVA
jgi:hypothetical protein